MNQHLMPWRYRWGVVGIRCFSASDSQRTSQVAVACGQSGAISAENPDYLDFLVDRGSVWVAHDERTVVGFAGTYQREGATYLTDLFVDPANQSQGHGRRLLEVAWADSVSRMTSSSQDPRALAAYTRFGARPRWPHLYLELAKVSMVSSKRFMTTPWVTDDCGWSWPIEGAITVAVFNADGQVEARSVVMVTDDGHATNVQVLRAVTPYPDGLVDLVAHLRTFVGGDGRLHMSIPGPHSALPKLLEAGARIVDVDLWCATNDVADLIDPLHELPSPAFG